MEKENKRGPWTVQETKLLYQNSFINVREDRVLQPDGQPGSYATVAMKPGIAVLPIDDRGRVYLIEQFRYALGRESIEVVCGAVDEEEPPLEAAHRELKEELGIEAEEWIDLGCFDMDTSIVRCPVYLYVAKGLRFTEAEREGTETIKPLKLSFEDAVEKAMSSIITHSPSCLLILKVNAFAGERLLSIRAAKETF